MKAWQQANEKFLSASSREKYLILATGVAVIVMLMFNFVLEPGMKQVKKQKQQIAQINKNNLNISQSIAEVQAKISDDPNAATAAEIKKLKARIQATDSELMALTSELINPLEMRLALQDLLQKQPGISIQSFATNPPTVVQLRDKVTESSEDESQLAQPVLYRHSITLVLTGRYFELQNYLTLVETLPWKFFWHEFDFNSKNYPAAELKLTIYSLSTQQEFLSV